MKIRANDVRAPMGALVGGGAQLRCFRKKSCLEFWNVCIDLDVEMT